jgi:two-component system LytT family response regulator
MQLVSVTNHDLLNVKTIKGYEFIPFNEIIFIKADHKYSLIFLLDQIRPVKAFASITLFESILPATLFYRCHRSYIINLKYRRILDKNRCVFMTGNHQLPISDDKLDDFLKLIELSN